MDLHGSGYLKSLHRWQRRQNSKYVGLKMQRTWSQGLEAGPRAGKGRKLLHCSPQGHPSSDFVPERAVWTSGL